MPLFTANDACAAVEATLQNHLNALAESRGLKAVTKWDQLPDLDALTAANLPAGAIVSPGLADTPRRRGDRRVDATWRVVVGVYDRGSDYAETADRVRTWAAVIRQTLLHHPTLGGAVAGVEWAVEEYAQVPERSGARTIGGCSVEFDITVHDVIDAEPYVAPDPAQPPGTPTVQSTSTSVSVR